MDSSSLPLSRSLAVGSCAVFTFAFVGPLYALKKTRIGHTTAKDEHGRPYTRDHPTVIKARLTSTALSMPVCTVGVWALARHCRFIPSKATSVDVAQATAFDQARLTLTLVGLRMPDSIFSAFNLVALPLALTGTLFIGPLYTAYLESALPGMRNFNFKRDVQEVVVSWQGFRNYIAAPITEEFVFRACVVATSALSAQSPSRLILLSPLYFGLAHVHHAYEFYVAHGRTREAAKRGIISSTVQFSYTYLMGVYGSFLFLRSSSIIPPIAAHIFCNWMGLPQLPSALRQFPDSRYAIWTTYLAGIAGFVKGLSSLTRPALFGMQFFWP